MRALIVLLALAPLSFAGPCGYGQRSHHRGHYGGHRSYNSYSHRRYSGRGYYRTYRRGHSTNGGCRTRRYYYPRYHGGYTYYGSRYYRPYLAFSPIYSRITTVLTLDDPVFDGTNDGADKDGLPQPRSKQVGNRFLSN